MSSKFNSTADTHGYSKRAGLRLAGRPAFGGSMRGVHTRSYGKGTYYTPSGVYNSSNKRIRFGMNTNPVYASRSIDYGNSSLDLSKLTAKKSCKFDKSLRTPRGRDNFVTKSMVSKLMQENKYLKNKFAKLRRNYTNLEKTHKDIKRASNVVTDSTVDNVDNSSLDLNTLVVESTLRKENRQLNDLLKETISKNDRLIKRVGAIEKEQKNVNCYFRNGNLDYQFFQ